MISQTDLDTINGDLALYFGVEYNGSPRYRLTWATTEMEMREGEYNIYWRDIFLRTERGVREVMKYPWARDKYVLEKFIYHPMKEIKGSEHGHYECVWPFMDSEGNYVAPVWKAIEIICKILDGPRIKYTESDAKEEELKLQKEEVEFFTDYLEDTGQSWMFMPGETGAQGVFLDSQKRKMD